MDLYREPDIIAEIRKRKLWWLGHAGRMLEDRTVKNVFKNIPEGERSDEKQRKRWLDDGEKKARDRYAWKSILKETEVLYGPYSQ